MANITFTLGFKSEDLRHLSLPIEIRKPNSALVARTVALKPVEVRAGHYYATASLPAGQQLLQAFEVSNQDLTVELVPEDEDQSSNEWKEASHYFQATKGPAVQATKGPVGRERMATRSLDSSRAESLRSVSDDPVAAQVRARVRLFAGNPLTGPLKLKPWESAAAVANIEQGVMVQFRVSDQNVPLIAQLIEPGGPVHNMMIPATPGNPALLVFARRPDATCGMEVHLGNSTADMLLRLSSASATTSAEEASRALLVDAERLLSDKQSNPIAAAIGATAILRFGKLDWLHTWTANLDSWFGWLPDGAAIHGEHLARKGKHAEAAIRFCEVPRRGLPFLSDALFYAVERLKWYTCLKPEQAVDIDQASTGAALEKLLPFAGVVHRQRSLTSFPGVEPHKPTADIDKAADLSKGTIRLAEWLG